MKKKTESYENKFKPLCEILSKEGKYIKINTSCLLPKKSESLCLNTNSDFYLIINERMSLIERITEFINNEDKNVLKIYGSDGIGKSITFLYFMTITIETKIKYKIIYFNLKDIFKYKANIDNYFRDALMQYYSRNNYNLDGITNAEDINKFNYKVYLSQIDIFKESLKKNKVKNTFWDILRHFCEFTKAEYHSLIIIDQYKSDYDQDDQLNSSILNNEENTSVKFIIASSLNDNKVKEDFITDLKMILKQESVNNIVTEDIIVSTNDVENELFKDFKLDETISEDKNKDFINISLFNSDITNDTNEKNIPKNKEKIEELFEKNNNIKEDDYIDLLNTNNSDKIKNHEIIYINNLISIENLIKGDENKKTLKLFNFNPKPFIKYNNFSIKNSNLSKEIFHKSFLVQRHKEIRDKVNTFYDSLMKRKFNNYSLESLKGTYLIKLNDIIIEKKSLNVKELINYLDIFPFKYLKIYLEKSKSPNENNIICIDENLNNKKFFLNYSFDFVEIAFSKIIHDIPSSTLININDLSGSAVGSFIESKIRNYIQKQKYEIRYFWNFVSFTKPPTNIKTIYDYDNFKAIKYDDIENKKITDYNNYYYIVPGSQTNRNIDSIILKPTISSAFNMISFQITKNKPNVKTKQEYIDDTFIAKSKIETNYGIKIENVYFYFILAKEYPSEETKKNLEIYNISYFYYSIKNEQFLLNNNIIDLRNIDREQARITQEIEVNEFKGFNAKRTLIKCAENYLQKKRKADRQRRIYENDFNNTLRHLFKQTPNINLKEDIEKKMKTIVKQNDKQYSSGYFTFQFVFFAYFNYEDYDLLSSDADYIGIIIVPNKKPEKNIDKSYCFIYKRKIFNSKILEKDIFKKLLSDKKPGREKQWPKTTFDISEIPKEFCERIFVFKIYELKHEIGQNNKDNIKENEDESKIRV